MTADQIQQALGKEQSLTATLAELGMTHRPSAKHAWVKDILLDGKVVGSFNADACWDWLNAGCPIAETNT